MPKLSIISGKEVVKAFNKLEYKEIETINE